MDMILSSPEAYRLLEMWNLPSWPDDCCVLRSHLIDLRRDSRWGRPFLEALNDRLESVLQAGHPV